MNDLRKAAEMALEALCLTNNEAVPDDIEERREAAIEALRQALAQSEQEPLGGEWVPCVKLPVIVHVRNQRDGETHISTREGITPVLPEDLIMRGVAGEEYPIGRELFERTYTFDVDAVNMSQERVDETAKSEHEQKTPLKVLNLTVFTENRLRNGRVYDVETLQAMTNRDILAIPDIGKKALKEVLDSLTEYKQVRTHTPEDIAKIKSKWVGLDGEIPGLGLVTEEFYNGMLFAEDILREKNGG